MYIYGNNLWLPIGKAITLLLKVVYEYNLTAAGMTTVPNALFNFGTKMLRKAIQLSI